MQLRFKIMALVILFPTAIYLLSISLHLIILFQEGPAWQELSESSSQSIMGETTKVQIYSILKDSLQSWTMQYQSEQRPLVNLLYGLQNMFKNIPYPADQIYEIPINTNYFYWKYQNIQDLQVFRSLPVYQYVLSFWMVSPLMKIEYQNGAFDQINYLCQDGLYISYRNNNVTIKYPDLLQFCETNSNCTSYINNFSDQIVQPVFAQTLDIWNIRCNQCLIQGIKKRAKQLDLVFNSNMITYGIQDPYQIYQYKNGVISNSTFLCIFQITSNETQQVEIKLNNTLMQDKSVRNYTFYYYSNQTTRYAYVLALYFYEEEKDEIKIDYQTLYKSSIIIYMTMDYSYHQSLSGVNDFVFQINLYRLVIMVIIYMIIYLHFIRKSVMTALSFEQPIKEIIKLLNIDMIYLENDEFKFKNYKKYFNSQEIKLLYKVIISLINNIKCVNNQLLLALIRVPKKYKRKQLKTDMHKKLTSLSKSDDDDTSISHQTQTDKNGAKFLYETLSEVQALIQLCKSKKFFKKRGNFQAVGICANNISKIHMKNKRYLEAMNEQEESLLLAYQDLQSIDEVENLKQEYLKQEDANPENSKKNILWYERLTTYMLRYFRKEEDPILQQLDLVSRSVRDKQQSIFRRTTFNKQNKTNLTNVRHSQDVLELPPFDKRNNRRNLTNNGLSTNINWVKSPMNEISEQMTENMIHSLRGDRFFSELQTDYEEKRKIVIYKIIFRKYQLASILYNYTIGQIQPSFLQEVVELYDEVLFETDKCVSSDNKFNFSSIYVMRISIHTKMAFCYGKLNQFEDANFAIQKAHSNLDEYKLNSENHSDIKEMVDVFKGMPPTILEEKIAYVEARLLMMQQKHFQASQKLLNILTAKSQCDPDIQKETIRSLEYIFLKSKCKDLQFLEKLYNENVKKKIEMIFLIDYSKNMTAEQFKLAHTMCQRTIESLPEDAKIGLYLFNDTIHEIFSLLEISEYRHLTLKVFEKFLIRPGGYGNLFDALNIAVNTLFDKDKMLIEQKLRKFNIHPGSNRQTIVDQELYKQTQMHKRRSMREDFITSKVSDSICVMEKLRSHETFEYPNDEPDNNTLRYICLFCENVNNYNDKQAQRLKESLCQKNVSLQIFNIANQNMNMLYLKKLADVSEKNKFINLNEDISRFFEELKQHEQEFTKRMYLEMF